MFCIDSYYSSLTLKLVLHACAILHMVPCRCSPHSLASALPHSHSSSEHAPELIVQLQLRLQDAIWEAEFQAEDRQQHLIHQRLARRSSLQRCAPSRSISMPSTSQQPNSHPKRDKSDLSECSPFAAASPSGTHDDLPGVSQQCGEQRRLTTAHLPLIRVPSSLNEAHPSTSASGTAMASSRSTGVSSSGSAGAVYVTPYMPPFGSISGKTGRQRRVSDASQAASPSLQAVLSLAAKVPPSGHASAVLKTGQVCRMRVQPKARVKAGLGSRDKCVPSTGKGKTMGDKGLLRQSSHTEAPPCLHRYRVFTATELISQLSQMCGWKSAERQADMLLPVAPSARPSAHCCMHDCFS